MATSSMRSEGGKKVDEIIWTAEELDIVEKPNGPAAAALLAAAFGSLFLGLMTTLNEASTSLHDWLIFQNRVGPLSGKTTVAGVAWVIAWVVLAPVLWKRNVPWAPVIIFAVALTAFGFLGTFPKFFEQFASD